MDDLIIVHPPNKERLEKPYMLHGVIGADARARSEMVATFQEAWSMREQFMEDHPDATGIRVAGFTTQFKYSEDGGVYNNFVPCEESLPDYSLELAERGLEYKRRVDLSFMGSFVPWELSGRTVEERSEKFPFDAELALAIFWDWARSAKVSVDL